MKLFVSNNTFYHITAQKTKLKLYIKKKQWIYYKISTQCDSLNLGIDRLTCC